MSLAPTPDTAASPVADTASIPQSDPSTLAAENDILDDIFSGRHALAADNVFDPTDTDDPNVVDPIAPPAPTDPATPPESGSPVPPASPAATTPPEGMVEVQWNGKTFFAPTGFDATYNSLRTVQANYDRLQAQQNQPPTHAPAHQTVPSTPASEPAPLELPASLVAEMHEAEAAADARGTFTKIIPKLMSHLQTEYINPLIEHMTLQQQQITNLSLVNRDATDQADISAYLQQQNYALDPAAVFAKSREVARAVLASNPNADVYGALRGQIILKAINETALRGATPHTTAAIVPVTTAAPVAPAPTPPKRTPGPSGASAAPATPTRPRDSDTGQFISSALDQTKAVIDNILGIGRKP